MIETIFYFPESKDQYENNKGNISARTISFVPTGDGETGDIYKNGIKYGSSIDRDEILSIINDAIEDADFDIPFASTTKAGIIKLGKGLKSVGSDGTVDVDFTGLNGIDGLDGLIENILKTIIDKNGTGVVVTPRLSSGTAIADIKVGNATKTIYAPAGSGSGSGTNEGKDYSITNFSNSGTTLTISQNNNSEKSVDIKNAITSSVSVSKLLDSGTPIADITVGNSTTRLFAPAGSGSGGGQGSGSEPYDDTDIKNAIKDLQDRANTTESDLRDLLDETEEEVREKFKNAFDTYEDLIDYYKQSGDTTPTKFTFGKEDADEWASQMGLITPNGDGTYNVGWSTLTQSYNSLAGEVAQIKANQSVGGEIDYEALSAGLYSYIDENAATSGMDSTWGKFVKKDDDEIQMLEWMQAAIKTYASDQEAYSRLLAAAKDYDENGNAIQEGIAKINAFVEKDSNGNYVAGTSLASMIDNGVNTSLSEVFTENSSNKAISGLYSRLRSAEIDAENASNIADLALDTVWGLQGRVEQLEDGSTVSESELINAIINNEDEIVSQTSLINRASLNEATTTLSDSIDGVSARIDLCVKKDSNGVIESGVTLNADKINIDANHELNLTSPHVNLDADKINMSGLITAINGDESSVVIDADKINVGGILIAALNVTGIDELVANKVNAQVGNIDNIVTEKIDAKMDNLEIDATNVTGIENIVVEKLVATKTGAGTTTVDGNGFFIEGVQAESAIRSDGSGDLADGAISWDTSGNVTIGANTTIGGTLNGATGTFSGAIKILKSGVDKVVINSNDTSTSSTQDVTIIDNSGFYVKRGSQGFRLTSSNGLERYNGSNFEPFYANHKARMGSGTLYSDDDFVLTTGNCTLPSSVQNGKVISILNIGGSRVNVSKGSSSYIKSGTHTFNSYADLNPGDKLEFVYYNGVWYSTFAGATTDGE